MSVNGPPKYVNAPIPQPSAAAGSCLLTPTGLAIRPVIPMMKGGKRQSKRCSICNKKKQMKGGFLPSVGQSFAVAAQKYISPIAMYGLYRFMTKKSKKSKTGKGTRRR
uniref:Uncharacterized protein n=1 Tax=viral metagenome TaxID=1070528 RepID=A0A6C0DH41_9ZZZZ